MWVSNYLAASKKKKAKTNKNKQKKQLISNSVKNYISSEKSRNLAH